MKMKLSLFLALILTLGLAACGGETAEDPPPAAAARAWFRFGHSPRPRTPKALSSENGRAGLPVQ